VKFDEPIAVGARVRVRQDPGFGPGPWPAEPLGTVTDGIEGHYTVVETRQGPERTYFIRFDEPQRDPDGDGPYETSQVLERYLEPAE
jgi:hypothetical protein